MSYSGEQIRFHTAGYIAAAIYLAQEGQENAASRILGVVGMALEGDGIKCPQPIKDSIARNISKPDPAELRNIHDMFVHPSNTVIERS